MAAKHPSACTEAPSCTEQFQGKSQEGASTGVNHLWLCVSTSSILPSCLDESWEGIGELPSCSPGLSTPSGGTIKESFCPGDAEGSELDSTKGSELAWRPGVGITCCSSHPSGCFIKRMSLCRDPTTPHFQVPREASPTVLLALDS